MIQASLSAISRRWSDSPGWACGRVKSASLRSQIASEWFGDALVPITAERHEANRTPSQQASIMNIVNTTNPDVTSACGCATPKEA
ncbi:hypothetical protein CEXT_66071 [Caerostris extrusa]|uniref:Uncharacterized protein n=1 Tax=Caerostris extrusa TaxID=172846 RepID=A0AAV4M9R4_CAEEX|nr:hypothetical protein CEXT_66071 [Caerostris extrusa]